MESPSLDIIAFLMSTVALVAAILASIGAKRSADRAKRVAAAHARTLRAHRQTCNCDWIRSLDNGPHAHGCPQYVPNGYYRAPF